MADLKISALPAASVALAGTEVLPIVQSSATKQVTVANLTAGRAVATGALTVTGDATLSTGNIVQGTAAKGVNFTANTPAAGMTSQLLNWYEEGTYSPVFTGAGGGTKTFAGNAQYTRLGRICTVFMYLYNQSSSAFSGALSVTLPFPGAAFQNFPVFGGVGNNVNWLVDASGSGAHGLYIQGVGAIDFGTVDSTVFNSNFSISIALTYQLP